MFNSNAPLLSPLLAESLTNPGFRVVTVPSPEIVANDVSALLHVTALLTTELSPLLMLAVAVSFNVAPAAMLADGEWHSGETLAAAFGISRAALAKRIDRLQEAWRTVIDRETWFELWTLAAGSEVP